MQARSDADGALTSSDAAYREIKGWILDGAVPLRMRLAEARVAERLSMSRTPVREALLRLFAERFLERHPDGGYRLSHPTGKTMHELYDIRKALELLAVRGATANAADRESEARAALTELHAEWIALAADAPDLDAGFVATDEEFHRCIAEASGNAELVETLERISERIRPVRTHDFITPGRIEATIAEHLGIVGAALAGGADAEALLERHIRESQAQVERAVGRVLERMLTTSEEGLGG